MAHEPRISGPGQEVEMAAKQDKARLEAAAKKLARKFVDDAQALFDDPAMTDEIYDGEVMAALVMAQGWAEDVQGGAA